MCGLVGVIHKRTKGKGFFKNETDIFKQLLIVDQLRGKDSTGIFYNAKAGESTIYTLKASYESGRLVLTKEYDNFNDILFKESNFAIGHNRAATSGAITVANAHPFREKHITLVHNGTLVTKKELDVDVEVDSHAICKSMANRGYKETLKLINGAFALIWYDSKEHTLFACRNTQRPLYLMETEGLYILASENKMVEWIADRNNTVIKSTTLLPTEKLYKFKLEDMSKYEVEDVDYKKWIQTASTNTNYSGTSYGKYAKDNSGHYSKYPKGRTVRFRAGDNLIVYQGGDYGRLEADFLIDQNSAWTSKFPDEYEDEYNAHIYGKVEYLRTLMGKKNLRGTISNSYWDRKNICNRYQIDNVSEFEPAKTVVSLPDKNAKKEAVCEWCRKAEAKHPMFQFHICDECFDTWGKEDANSMYGC